MRIQKTEKYAYPSYPWQGDEKGFYIPDALIECFVQAARPTARTLFAAHIQAGNTLPSLNEHRILISHPVLSWQQSCALIRTAFHEFDSQLGEKAGTAIEQKERWQLSPTTPGAAGGVCLPAHCEENERPFAIINLAYDQTINDAVYGAHELGHLLADDALNEAGFTCHDFPCHIAEIQAFTAQHILYDSLSRHPDTSIKQAGQKHFIAEITRNIYAVPVGLGALAAEKKAISHPDTTLQNEYAPILKDWLGENWHTYQKAQYLSDHIQDRRKRDLNGISDLHQHAMAAIVAGGLFLHLKNQNPAVRTQQLRYLYGYNGPKTIEDVLDAFGIVSADARTQMAHQALSYIAAPLTSFQEHVPQGAQKNGRLLSPIPS